MNKGEIIKRKKGKNVHTPRNLILLTQENIPFNYREAYKSLRTNIKFIAKTEEANSFVITSSAQMESKSNVSVNLAITLAEEGKRVVLLDGDFRKPCIHRYLKINMHGQGITNVLMGECPLSGAIYHEEELNIDVLPVGTVPPNPTELLSSERMRAILQALKDCYDYVIIDTPPVSYVTDAAIIGGMVDGAFLVVRSDYSPVEMVQLAKEKLESVNVKIFGVILSRFDAEKAGSQSGHYYSYNKYYYYYYNYDE